MTDCRRILYALARAIGDIVSIRTGRVGIRIGRRAIGRIFGLILRSLFR